MGFVLKKIRLLAFLLRRVPRLGLGQVARGIHERQLAYLAMELAEALPGRADTIVDVGAHAGLVADALDFLYRPSRIWLFEPNPAQRPVLEQRFRGRAQFQIIGKCLGESVGEVTFNVHEFDAASSLFDCKPGHLSAFGFSEQKTAVKVPMTTLREALPADFPPIDLLVLDCQGAELSVLRGAGSTLGRTNWILCEVSFDPIYDGAPLWHEIHEFLRKSGFELRSLGAFSGAGSCVQWADALYGRAGAGLNPIDDA